MNPINKFILQSIELTDTEKKDDNYTHPYRSKILFEGRDAGISITGINLLKQFYFEDGRYLLIVDEDCPHEEGLHFYLLSKHIKKIDSLQMGFRYLTGSFNLKDITASDSLTFSFFDENEVWKLTVHKRLGFRWFSIPASKFVFPCPFWLSYFSCKCLTKRPTINGAKHLLV